MKNLCNLNSDKIESQGYSLIQNLRDVVTGFNQITRYPDVFLAAHEYTFPNRLD